jgi:hypothetical protein
VRSEVLKEVNENISLVGHEPTKSGRKTNISEPMTVSTETFVPAPPSRGYKTVLHPEDEDTKFL